MQEALSPVRSTEAREVEETREEGLFVRSLQRLRAAADPLELARAALDAAMALTRSGRGRVSTFVANRGWVCAATREQPRAITQPRGTESGSPLVHRVDVGREPFLLLELHEPRAGRFDDGKRELIAYLADEVEALAQTFAFR